MSFNDPRSSANFNLFRLFYWSGMSGKPRFIGVTTHKMARRLKIDDFQEKLSDGDSAAAITFITLVAITAKGIFLESRPDTHSNFQMIRHGAGFGCQKGRNVAGEGPCQSAPAAERHGPARTRTLLPKEKQNPLGMRAKQDFESQSGN